MEASEPTIFFKKEISFADLSSSEVSFFEDDHVFAQQTEEFFQQWGSSFCLILKVFITCQRNVSRNWRSCEMKSCEDHEEQTNDGSLIEAFDGISIIDSVLL